jgi:hypothetical protein
MTYRVKRIVSVLCLVAAIFSAALLPVSGHCENLRFVFMADGRGDALTDLINTTVLNAINSQILALSPRPSFVVYGGDSVYRGHSGGAYNFQKFKDAMRSLTDAGIKLYTVMGNHELYWEGTTGFSMANQHPGGVLGGRGAERTDICHNPKLFFGPIALGESLKVSVLDRFLN